MLKEIKSMFSRLEKQVSKGTLFDVITPGLIIAIPVGLIVILVIITLLIIYISRKLIKKTIKENEKTQGQINEKKDE